MIIKKKKARLQEINTNKEFKARNQQVTHNQQSLHAIKKENPNE